MLPLAILLAACGGDPDTGTGEAASPHTGDSLADDSGETGAPVELVDAALVEGGVVSCADPSLRESEGPLYVAEGGEHWVNQLLPDLQSDRPNSRGVVIADLDGDGVLDLYLPNMGPDQLFIGQGDETWSEETGERWPGDDDLTAGGSAIDVDDDGDLDLLALNRGGANQLYLNDGSGRFTVAPESGLSDVDAGSVTSTWGDADGDGDLDLFIGAHFSVGDAGLVDGLPSAAEPSELYENLGGGRLSDRSADLPDVVQDSFVYAATWLDLDGDADNDLYLVNDFGNDYQPNLLIENGLEAGAWGLTEATAGTGLGVVIEGMGLGVGDVNGDLLPDLLMSSWDDIVLLESLGDGTWYDSSLSRGLVHDDERHVAWGLELVDMDNDGDLDAPVLFGFINIESLQGFDNPRDQPDAMFIQGDDGAFTESADAWGFADRGYNRGFAMADLNDDGWMDLVKVDIIGPRKIYLSRCGAEGWLRVRLDQPAPNVDAVGARVIVEGGGQTWIRWILGAGTNLNCAGPLEAHFGLGDLDAAERITVIWPDGGRSVFEDVATRQVIEISRAE